MKTTTIRTGRRILGVLLALTLLLPTVATSLAAAEDDFAFGFALPTTLIMQDDPLPQAQTWGIHLARNEMEGFQLIYREKKLAQRKIRLEVTPFSHSNGTDALTPELYQLVYIESLRAEGALDGYAGDGYFYPDALLPLEGDSVEAKQNENTAFYIEVKSAEDAVPGLYTATVSVVDDTNSATLLSVPVTAEVWNITLPQERYSGAILPIGWTNGIFYSSLFECNGVPRGSYGWYNWTNGTVPFPDERQQAIVKGYFDYLLEHGISGGMLPYDILDPRADAYMDDPRVKQFIVPFKDDVRYMPIYFPEYERGPVEQGIYIDHLTQIAEKIKSNPEWERKAVFYAPSGDLPDLLNPIEFEKYIMYMQDLAAIWPGFHSIIPFASGDPEYIDRLKQGGNDMVTPMLVWYNDPIVVDKTREWDSKWWWVVGAPSPKINADKIAGNRPIVEWDRGGNWSPGLFLGARGYEPRTLFWQQFRYGVDGLYSWSAAYWQYADYKPWDGLLGSGDGLLLYPGQPVNRDPNTPIGSLRLKNLATGLDDFDYLSLAKEFLDETTVANALHDVHADNALHKYGPSDGVNGENYEAVRLKLGDALSAASAVPVTGVTLNANAQTINAGSTFQLAETVAPSNADNKAVTWSSSDTAVAIVDANGLVTAKAEGTASITVTTVDGGKTAQCVITVEMPQLLQPPAITSANNKTVDSGTGGTFQVTATGAAPITFGLTGAPSGVTINFSTGLITIAGSVAQGTYPFTVTASNGVGSDAAQSFTLTVNNSGGGTTTKKYIFATKYEPTFWNWLMFIFLFGWIWM